MSDQTETRHVEAEFHHQDAQAQIEISPAAPSRPRRWSLGARLTVIVLCLGLAATAVCALMAVSRISERTNEQADQIGTLKHQLATVKTAAEQPSPAFHLPIILSRYGLCVTDTTNSATGDLAAVTLQTPVRAGGNVSCPHGNFVSVRPAP